MNELREMRKESARAHSGRATGGFTLIELMITVAIVGILMAIAISSYEFARIKTRRGAAESCLTEWAQYMERFYTTNITYLDSSGNPAPDPLLPCKADLSQSYSFTVPTNTATTFVIQAAPILRQLAKDTLCGTMTIDNAGRKTVSGTSSADVKQCW